MKILFWTDGFWPRTGGIETQGLAFVQGMQQKGHEYRVFAQEDPPKTQERQVYSGISIRRFDFRKIQRDLKCLRAIQEELQQVVREFQPDVVHLNSSAGLATLVFLLIRQIFHSPIILTLHAPFFYTGQNPILTRIVDVCDQVYCVSQWVLDQTIKLVPQAAHKLNLIYNGLPLPEIPPTPLPFSPPLFLLLGRLVPEKGFNTAIEAFSLLKKSSSTAKLAIAGDGPDRFSLESLVQKLSLDVEFTGELSREEGLHWINRATIVIVPSYFEPFGLVAIEAMHLMRPVLASRTGGLTEIVVDGETGRLLPPQDPVALYHAMKVLIDQPAKATQMGLNGYKRATEQFTLEQNLVAYEKSLGSLFKEAFFIR